MTQFRLLFRLRDRLDKAVHDLLNSINCTKLYLDFNLDHQARLVPYQGKVAFACHTHNPWKYDVLGLLSADLYLQEKQRRWRQNGDHIHFVWVLPLWISHILYPLFLEVRTEGVCACECICIVHKEFLFFWVCLIRLLWCELGLSVFVMLLIWS